MKGRTTHYLVLMAILVAITTSTSAIVAQTISRQVISFAGGLASLHDTHINWTAGETFIGQASSSDQQARLTIGFQQPNIDIKAPSLDFDFPITLSPNPTPDLVQILVKDPTLQDLRLTLSNANGQVLVPSLLLHPWKNEFDLSSYPAGVYLITVEAEGSGRRQTHKLVKY